VRLSFAAPLALIALAASAPVAHAARVSVERSDAGVVYVSVLGGAEADVLTISSPAADRFVVTQGAGLPLTVAGRACSVTAPGRAECSAPGGQGALLMGGDGDDRLAVSGPVGAGSWLSATTAPTT